MNTQRKKRICFVTAIPGSAYSFLRDHMVALREEYEVYYVSNEPDESKVAVVHDGYYCADIQRGISIGKDIKAIFQLYGFFRRERFDAVHSVTPKAGLLSSIAGFFARVPIRIHTFTGQVWANKKGVTRRLLRFMDKMIALFDNQLLVDGEGQRQFLIQNKVLSETNSRVLGNGSICGVNLDRFSPDPELRLAARSEIKNVGSKTVFVFIGRLNRDKGLFVLLPAFNRLAREREDVFLLLFGPDEEDVASHFGEYAALNEQTFCYYGATPEPQVMLQAGDIFVLPTYREGFGSSVIEASALGLPVICSDVYGVMDAMVDGETGLRCHVGDADSLYAAMKSLTEDPALRVKLGNAGRERVRRLFDGKEVTRYWVAFYREILG